MYNLLKYTLIFGIIKLVKQTLFEQRINDQKVDKKRKIFTVHCSLNMKYLVRWQRVTFFAIHIEIKDMTNKRK